MISMSDEFSLTPFLSPGELYVTIERRQAKQDKQPDSLPTGRQGKL